MNRSLAGILIDFLADKRPMSTGMVALFQAGGQGFGREVDLLQKRGREKVAT